MMIFAFSFRPIELNVQPRIVLNRTMRYPKQEEGYSDEELSFSYAFIAIFPVEKQHYLV